MKTPVTHTPAPRRTAPAKGTASTRGARTRGAIVTEARERFTTSGFDQTKLADVAAAAGVSEPTVAHHFGSKTGLLLAVMNAYYDELVAEIERVVDAPSSPGERLAAFARFWLQTHERSHDLHAVFASQADWRDPASAGSTAFRENNRRVTRVFERLVDDLKAEGSIDPDTPTRLIRDAFFGTAEHAFRGRLPARRPPPLDAVADQILEFVLRGAAPAGSQLGASAADAVTLEQIHGKLEALLRQR